MLLLAQVSGNPALRDAALVFALLAAITAAAFAQPYENNPEYFDYLTPPTLSERVYQTFCGT